MGSGLLKSQGNPQLIATTSKELGLSNTRVFKLIKECKVTHDFYGLGKTIYFNLEALQEKIVGAKAEKVKKAEAKTAKPKREKRKSRTFPLMLKSKMKTQSLKSLKLVREAMKQAISPIRLATKCWTMSQQPWQAMTWMKQMKTTSMTKTMKRILTTIPMMMKTTIFPARRMSNAKTGYSI